MIVSGEEDMNQTCCIPRTRCTVGGFFGLPRLTRWIFRWASSSSTPLKREKSKSVFADVTVRSVRRCSSVAPASSPATWGTFRFLDFVPSEKNIHNQTWGHVWRGAEHEIRWNFTSARGGTWSAHSPDAPCKYALIDQDQVWSYQNEYTDLVHILFMVSCYWTLSTYILLIFCSTCANAIVTNQWFHQLA